MRLSVSSLFRRMIWMLALLWASSTIAEEFPKKPINFVVSVGAGGATDTLARVIGEKLAVRLGQPVIVHQKPGATGTIAARAVLGMPADGYNALFTSTFFLQALHVLKDPGYKLDDFVGVSNVAAPGVVLVVNATSPHKTLADLLSFARTPGNSVNYGAVGLGSSTHIYGETLRVDSKASLRSVNYNSEPQEITDILGGHLDAGILSFTAVQPMIESGRLRPLAVVGSQRLQKLPNVPTLAELGFPRVNLIGWFGVLLPSGTPKARVETLSTAIQQIVADPEMKARLEGLGYQPVGDSADVFTKNLRRDSDTWRRLIREAGIQPE